MNNLTVEDIAKRAGAAREFLERHSTVLEHGSNKGNFFRDQALFDALFRETIMCLPCHVLEISLEKALTSVNSSGVRDFLAEYGSIQRPFHSPAFIDDNSFIAERIVDSGATVIIDLFSGDGETVEKYKSAAERDGRSLFLIGIDGCVDNVSKAEQRNILSTIFLPYGMLPDLELAGLCSKFLKGKCEKSGDSTGYHPKVSREVAKKYLARDNDNSISFLVSVGGCGDATDIAVNYAIKFPIQAFYIQGCCFGDITSLEFKTQGLEGIKLTKEARSLLSHKYQAKLHNIRADEIIPQIGLIKSIFEKVGATIEVEAHRVEANPLCSNLYLKDVLTTMVVLERANRLAEFGYNVSLGYDGAIYGNRTA